MGLRRRRASVFEMMNAPVSMKQGFRSWHLYESVSLSKTTSFLSPALNIQSGWYLATLHAVTSESAPVA